MKKIFTLIAASFFTVALFAADRRPVVTLKASRNYEVIIDGQSYSGRSNAMNLSNIRNGQHSIKVYEINQSRFRKFKKLVSASTFQVRKNDVEINVDSRGQIRISEDRFGRDMKDDQGDNDWGNKGYDKKGSRDQNRRDQDQDNDKNSRGNRFYGMIKVFQPSGIPGGFFCTATEINFLGCSLFVN